jgi:hypothetical protein
MGAGRWKLGQRRIKYEKGLRLHSDGDFETDIREHQTRDMSPLNAYEAEKAATKK